MMCSHEPTTTTRLQVGQLEQHTYEAADYVRLRPTRTVRDNNIKDILH